MCNKMSMSEAGKLGSISSKATQQKQKQERIEEYNKNPKLCACCNQPIPYSSRQNKYCNHSCAAIYNNKKRGCKSHSRLPNCIVCGNKTKKGSHKYCCIPCGAIDKWNATKKKIESEQKATGIKTAKRYLLETQGHKCAIPHCGISEWHGQPVLLICDHINGNSEDWSLSNLRLICSNCDAQTPFYKARNKGNGRHSRRQRYKDGKSF
jgi:hypothetical protein